MTKQDALRRLVLLRGLYLAELMKSEVCCNERLLKFNLENREMCDIAIAAIRAEIAAEEGGDIAVEG